MFKEVVRTAPFIEFPVVDETSSKKNEFDVQVSAKCTLQVYCNALLSMICNLDKSQVKPFLEYQCTQLIDAVIWLNKLEKLIDLNDDLIITKQHKLNINKACRSIDLLRERIEVKKKSAKNNRFNFEVVKSKLKEYNTHEEKISYLLDVQTEYKQLRSTVLKPNAMPLDQQIELEKEKLHQQEILKEKTAQRAELLGKYQSKNKNKPTLQITCNLNYFADIFYRLMHEENIITGTSKDLADHIAAGYLDKDGQPISPESINTMLKPSNSDKRPKGNSRYKL